jgi:diguanylate cyclase (GGDEF)-like protein/PAS domain S-box-containing protein
MRGTLAENQERLNLTLRSSGIAIWDWVIPGNAITADENSCALFGLPAGEFPKTVEGFASLVHPADRERVEREVAASVESGAEYNTEFRVVWPNGSVHFVAARAKVYKDEKGRPVRLTGASWDISRQKRIEEEVRVTNEKLQTSLEHLQRRNEERTLLTEMADLLQACGSSAEAHDIIGRFCGQLFPQYAGALFIFSASRNLVHSVAVWNDPLIPEPEFVPNDCWALRRGQPHVVHSKRFATSCNHLKDVRRAGQACIPMMAQGTGLGILYLQSCENAPDQQASSPEFLEGAEQQLVLSAAEQIALSLANLSLQDALRLQTIRDPLTGLFNRRYLEETFERELHRMVRSHRPACLAMVDLDHFKVFNDTFGHEGGDALLRAFGQFLKEHLRAGDIACRYGGEEFCILFCETSMENALRRCDQIRLEVKQLAVHYGGRHLGPVTISVGVSSYPIHGDKVPDLVTAADAALYQAKTAGRDRVVAAAVADSAASTASLQC